MKVLLDTHVFLWWILNDERLGQKARVIIADGANEVFLSAASCWEIAIKTELGRLRLPKPPDIYVPDQMAMNALKGLPISPVHALRVSKLPNHHRDPFDRILVAQSQLEKIPLVTSDPLISRYDVRTLWND